MTNRARAFFITSCRIIIFCPLMPNTVKRYPFPSPQNCRDRKIFFSSFGRFLTFLFQLSVLQVKKSQNDWIIMFNFRLGKLYLLIVDKSWSILIVDKHQIVEFFYRYKCLLIIQKTCNWMATAIYNLVTKRAVGKELQIFCNKLGIGILVCLTVSIAEG